MRDTPKMSRRAHELQLVLDALTSLPEHRRALADQHWWDPTAGIACALGEFARQHTNVRLHLFTPLSYSAHLAQVAEKNLSNRTIKEVICMNDRCEAQDARERYVHVVKTLRDRIAEEIEFHSEVQLPWIRTEENSDVF